MTEQISMLDCIHVAAIKRTYWHRSITQETQLKHKKELLRALQEKKAELYVAYLRSHIVSIFAW